MASGGVNKPFPRFHHGIAVADAPSRLGALASAQIVVVTGLMARELGGGRMAQFVAGVAALFCLDYVATGSIFSMDVLDQLWWALASLTLARLARRDAPRLWLLVGLIGAVALLTKLTVLFFGLSLVLALLVTPTRRHLRTPWPWLGGGLAFLGLLPYLVWNAVNGWPTAATVRIYGPLTQPLADRLGWESLTRTVEQVYAGLPPAQRARACVLTENYGEAGALQLLAAPGRLPPVISGHNNYYLWGPGTCTGEVLIVVGFSPSDVQGARALYARITLAAVERCRYCVSFEQTLPIYVLSRPTGAIFPRMWPTVKHYD